MQIRQFTISAVLAALLAAAAIPALAQEKGGKGEKLATVNGVSIPMSRMETVMKVRTQQGQPDTAEVRAAIRDQLITSEVVAQESTKRGIAKRSDVINQLDLARQQVLVQSFVQDYFKTHQPGEAELRREYEAIKSQLGDREYKARHILVEKPAEAQDVLAKLKKGEKFEDVAKAMSKDPGSKDAGGSLEWASPSGYVKPFSDAMVKLEKGKYTTEPVQTQFGYHIIMLEDSRDLKVPTFDEVKPNLVQRVQQQMLEKEIVGLRAKAKVD